jgi:O-antigen/teichoic acid export membrane protein
MSTAAYGDYNVAFGVMSIAASLMLLGSDNSSRRFMPGFYQGSDAEQLTSYISWNFGLVGKAFVVCFVLAGGLLLAAILSHQLGYRAFTEHHLAYHALWIAPLASLTLLFSSYFTSTGHPIAGGSFQGFVVYALMMLFFFIAAYLLGTPLTGDLTIILVWLATFLALLGLQIATFRTRAARLLTALRGAVTARTPAPSRLWTQTSLRMVSARLIQTLVWYLDLFIVELVSPHEESTGHYAAALTIVHLVYLIPFYVSFFIAPRIGYLHDRPEDRALLQRLIDSTNLVIFLLVAAMLLVNSAWGDALLGLFGPGYTEAGLALAILTFGNAVGGVTRIPRALLLYAGQERYILYFSGLDLLLVLVFGIPATYYWGISGIATVSAAVMIIQAIGFTLMAKQHNRGLRPLTVL